MDRISSYFKFMIYVVLNKKISFTKNNSLTLIAVKKAYYSEPNKQIFGHRNSTCSNTYFNKFQRLKNYKSRFSKTCCIYNN